MEEKLDPNAKHGVYKFVHNGEIIYIGKADAGIGKRIFQHGHTGDNIPKEAWSEINASEVYYIVLPNASVTEFVELHLIKRYRPKWNKSGVDNVWSDFPIEEPEWILFDKEAPEESKPTHSYKAVEGLPAYLQFPLSGVKRNLIHTKILVWYKHWFLLNAIKNGHFKNNSPYYLKFFKKTLPKICFELDRSDSFFWTDHNRIYYCVYFDNRGRGNNNESYFRINLHSDIFAHLEQGIKYYQNRLSLLISFLKDNYKEKAFDSLKFRGEDARYVTEIFLNHLNQNEDNGDLFKPGMSCDVL